MGTSPRLYVYKLTTDNGGAPCVTADLLSLAICKPSIRRTAQKNDWIFGFGGKHLKGRLIYIARVTERVGNGSYYEDETYEGRDDRVYRRNEDGEFQLRPKAKYHGDGEHHKSDLGKRAISANLTSMRMLLRFLAKTSGTGGTKAHSCRERCRGDVGEPSTCHLKLVGE